MLSNGKVFIAKRSDKSDTGAGVWSVPAGKVKYTETPLEAAVREAKEEINIDVEVVKELMCRTATIKVKGDDAYRLFFT